MTPENIIYTPPASNRIDLNLNDKWKFSRSDVSGAENISLDDSGWESINLPHTWNKLDGQDGGGDYYRGIGWYRKRFTIDAVHSGKNIFIKFDGANIVAELYVNGICAGQHKGGNAAFCFEVTPHIHFGSDNLIAVKVSNAVNNDIPPITADYTFFGGIYRGVHLLVIDKLGITPLDYGSSGVYLKQSRVSADSADLQITAKIKNNYSVPKNVTIRSVVVDGENKIVQTLTSTERLEAGAHYNSIQNSRIPNPHLWNGLSDPYLYKVYVEIKDGNSVPDLIVQPLGFRFFSIDPDNGFYLNGNSLALHGVNRHQDRLNKGWAIGKDEHLEDFNLIKEMGANAIRLAHYQHAGYFYDLCDRGGLVVWAEIPFVDEVKISPAFYTNATEELVELIRQNYNHPSICFWGVGNEVRRGDPNELLTQLNDLAHGEDPGRLSTYASDAADNDNRNWHTDVTAFNKYFGWYTGSYNDFAGWADNVHANYPAKRIGVSEYGAGAGIHFHSDNPANQDHSEEYQNLFHETYWQAMKRRPYLWGTFIWNMFDFACDGRNEGESPGRNDKGLVTYDRRIKKDSFFWYKANWTDSPVIYITGRRFTHRNNAGTEVKVYSNCDSVELKVNGISQGVLKSTGDKIFKWSVTLAEGKNDILAIGTKNSTRQSDSCVWIL